MGDLIDRQAAIDALVTAIRKDPYYDSNEAINGLGVCDVRVILNDLPSAQPEVIRCKDCKWKQGSECVRFADVRPFPDDYCSRAERKES